MNLDRVEKIAEAVLYEGYMLYPYRASAVKNQQRWNFGVLAPRAYSEQQNGTEAATMQTECLFHCGPSARLSVKIRFLQAVDRSLGKLSHPLHSLPSDDQVRFEPVDKLELAGRTYIPWQEAREREVCALTEYPTGDLLRHLHFFQFAAGKEMEPLRDDAGLVAGVLIRDWKQLSGDVEVTLSRCKNDVTKVTVSIRNLTAYGQPENRADALKYSFLSTHTILRLEDGEFISLLDPPDNLKSLAAACSNAGTWPVLAGEPGERSTMLSSQIILYDYPQIAPESPGSLFDGTEIDEILSLRILTMTDEEKDEMRRSDERARQILERTESMPPEQFMKLHGVLREFRPVISSSIRETP
ncbi:MAG: hypothetical protein JO300_08515 [Silvibacterium sp.]|nr:hypothetical protein [Silvibacterium sp.]